MNIRKYQESDWEQLRPIIEKVFRAGESYAFAPDISEQQAHQVWIDVPQEAYVALDKDNNILGSYYIKANQPGLGAHVCNCGYIVAEAARGQGVATKLCLHSQQTAIAMGFIAMQYNLVVATNTAAIHLWKKLGFQVIGTLPKAFNSKNTGYVDALVMYKELTS